MRTAIVTGKGQVELADVPEREPGPGEAKLAVSLCGICGSDLHGYRGSFGYPFRPGHEVCGVILETGSGVEDWAEGQRICVEPFSYCGECDVCREGDYLMCDSMSSFFWGQHNAMTERVVVPAASLCAVPDALSDAEGMIVEPLAVAVSVVRRGGIRPGTRVGVIGAGTIGLLCTGAAAAAGAHVEVVSDRFGHLLEAATALGARRTVLVGEENAVGVAREVTDDAGLDVVIDAAGAGDSLDTALRMLRKRGRAVLVAVSQKPQPLDYGLLVNRKLEVVGSFCYGAPDGKRDFDTAVELVADGKVDAGRLVTHTFPLDDAGEALRVADDKSTGSIKVAVRCS